MKNMEPIEIYEDLKEKIIWLEHKPENTLNLVQLADHYKVSRNPITLALTRLDAEGWVVRHGTHYMVCPLTLDRIREITEIRSILEVQANIWAMHRMTEDGMTALQKIKEKIHSFPKGAGNREIVQLDMYFHQLLFRESRNHKLFQVLNNMLSHYFRFWLSLPRKIEPGEFFVEALEIIKAVEEKDEVRLRAASAEHIKISLDEIMYT